MILSVPRCRMRWPCMCMMMGTKPSAHYKHFAIETHACRGPLSEVLSSMMHILVHISRCPAVSAAQDSAAHKTPMKALLAPVYEAEVDCIKALPAACKLTA